MRNFVAGWLALVAFAACASTPSEVEVVAPEQEHVVVLQWAVHSPLLEPPPLYFAEAIPVPETVLNISTPSSRGRWTLLGPRADCPSPFIRVGPGGEAERALDLGAGRVPSLSTHCLSIPASPETPPDERRQPGTP